ncbi:hypothetical protein [Lacunisphaera limnophila]|nr:hypothetical protein [Lacunisphaera limnophila]
MKDPVMAKLKADAGIVLADLWRAWRHQPPVEAADWSSDRLVQVRVTEGQDSSPRVSPPSGLCYFHLN